MKKIIILHYMLVILMANLIQQQIFNNFLEFGYIKNMN